MFASKDKKKGAAKEEPGQKEVSQQDLESAAYFRWIERGCPLDDSLTDWVEAEKDLKARG